MYVDDLREEWCAYSDGYRRAVSVSVQDRALAALGTLSEARDAVLAFLCAPSIGYYPAPCEVCESTDICCGDDEAGYCVLHCGPHYRIPRDCQRMDCDS